jgi:hypothetical protein
MSTLVCRIELDKDKGITLTVENKDGQITQTAVMNGESITFTSKGEQETSTITQKPDSVVIKCKDFTLETETITCKSTKDTLHQSDQKFDIKSTQDMTLTSKAKLTEKAASDANLSGMKVTVSAKDKAEISGLNTAVKATTKMEMEGLTLAIKGTGQAEMEGGASLKVSSKGMLNLESTGVTTLKGSMTNIQGTLVKLG